MNYKEVIESRYNRQKWQLLLHDIFGNKVDFWENPYEITTNSQLSKQTLWLGTITLSDGETISVYEVELTDAVDIERNRRGIRDMLLTDWRNNGNAGAFMFCYRKNESVLRFSYVSEAWTFADDGTYQKESTDAKRFTYLLGEGHRSRTAIQQFEKLKASSQKLKDLTKAFSVDAVSDMFFDEYKKNYEDIIQFITGKRMVKVNNKWEEQVKNDPCEYIMQEFAAFANPEKAVRDYVKKLMGRLVFLQFLQKKGWLGVPANAEWGSGDPEFIQNLFAQTADKDHFIDNVLEALFNDLNSEDERKLPQYRTPYLNGGLFERDASDETNFPLPAKYMQQMLDFFSSYNFTIDENDPDDAEVGVDPEMLGRIFENLLEDNKDKGAFYTPKEIVTYMCRESLIAYLQTNVDDEPTKEAIRQFVTNHEKNDKLPADTDQKLKDVKICDPAIGSGAFPMGLLKELFLCRTALEGISQHQAAEIKKHIIQQNIYGVDIERGAVDIARLRFWLSLIVDEETPQALPNLDFKIMQGNSLLEQYKGVDLSTMTDAKWNENESLSLFENMLDVLRRDLRIMIAQYYDCSNHKEKQALKAKIIENVKQQLKEQHIAVGFEDIAIDSNSKFFLWHTWFFDVFATGGFDIVVGNPPYGAKLSLEEKQIYKRTYITAQTKSGIQKGSTDSYTLFIERGFSMIAKGGCITYIVPISFTSSDSLSGVHRLLMNSCDIIRVSSYAVRPQPVFENAVVNTSIFLCQRTDTKAKHVYSTKMHRKGRNFNLQNLIDNLEFTNVEDFLQFGRIPKVGSDTERDILAKLRKMQKVSFYERRTGAPIVYRFAGGRYYKVVTNYSVGSSAERIIHFPQEYANAIGCCLSSNLSFWFYQIYSDNLNWKSCEISSFPLPPFNNEVLTKLNDLYAEYLEDIERNANVRITSGTSSYNVATFKEYKIGKSKSIIDRIDDYIGPLYGLTKKEIDFIKNYEIEFRLSDEE